MLLQLRHTILTLLPAAVLLLLSVTERTAAQVELLPLDHPAVQALLRLYEYGAIPEFPREHLPVSRGLARRLFETAAADSTLPSALRIQAQYYLDELSADIGQIPTAVLVPLSDSDIWFFGDPIDRHPIAIMEYRDTAADARLVFEPVLDAEMRSDQGGGTAVILTGGAQLRGSLFDVVGFSSRITNGTVRGDLAPVLRDPVFSRHGGFGRTAFGRDFDFGSGHVRVAYKGVGLEIGREKVQLGGNADRSLLLGSHLASDVDYLRLTANVGLVQFTHFHGALLAESRTNPFGFGAEIPPKYAAMHLLSLGPFAGIRASIGESVIYSGRPFEIGYLNPFNFMKAQEPYLRDRDNANMYLSITGNPVRGLFLEGEFLLDDYRFSKIGEGHWANKTAWRVGAGAVAVPVGWLDLFASYTRVEPYTFSHFNPENIYTHDSTLLSGSSIPPNSYLVEFRLRSTPFAGLWEPLATTWVTASVGFGEHGANIMQGDSLVRNVGGDPRFSIGPEGSQTVTFLDGITETLFRARLDIETEPLRNVYVRFSAIHESVKRSEEETGQTQLRLGIRFGAH